MRRFLQWNADTMRRALEVTLLCVCVVLAARTVSAQERKGFWFDFGVGQGSMAVSAEGSQIDRGASGVASLDVGWAMRPSLLVGLGIRSAALDVSGTYVTGGAVTNLMGVVAYYPRSSSGLFVKGGIGGTFVDLTMIDQGAKRLTNVARGLGLSGRLGYDIYLGRGFSVTPSGGLWYGRTGSWQVLGDSFFPNWQHSVVDATVSVSFH